MQGELMKKFLLVAAGVFFLHCSTPPEEDLPKLEIKGPATLELAAGDSSAQFTTEKTVLELNGKRSTAAYYAFYLSSSDPNVAAVADKQWLRAKSPGQAVITAWDESSLNADRNGPLKSANSITVTVK
jgi:hypothetical protein